MDKREILSQLIDYYADGNQSDFCRKTGIDKSCLSRMLSGKANVTDRQMYKVMAAIPEARAFIEGRSSLPKPKSATEIIRDLEAEVEALKKDIAIKNRTIDALLSKQGF